MEENIDNWRGKDFYDDLATRGAGIYSCFNEAKDLNHFPIWEWMLEEIEENSRVLDIGCGHGLFAKYFTDKNGGWIIGVDFSDIVIKKARHNLPWANYPRSRFLCLDVEDPNSDLFHLILGPPPFGLDYNIVIFSEILEHIKDDLALLKQVPIGKEVFLTVPNFGGEGHTRWFSSIEDVKERYREVLIIHEEFIHVNWFAVRGVTYK